MAKGKTNRKTSAGGTAANLGFEAQLWQAADALRGSMDAAEYKHVVLGLIFLKYISKSISPMPLKSFTPGSKLSASKAQTRKTPMSTEHRTSSGCLRRRAGRT